MGRRKLSQKITEYMTRLNLGIIGIDITTKEFDSAELPNTLNENTRNRLIKQLSGKKSFTVFVKHKVYSNSGKETKEFLSWKLEERESAGTNKAFHLSGPVLYALINGGVLIIDEIEAKMHPIMTMETINLFLDEETNPNNAQLVFATHDTNLLSYSSLRRDQIYFSEKNAWESTEIYSLSDFVYIDQKDNSKTKKKGLTRIRKKIF